jgi:hypothetical protein
MATPSGPDCRYPTSMSHCPRHFFERAVAESLKLSLTAYKPVRRLIRETSR